jgi:hypothetical protein
VIKNNEKVFSTVDLSFLEVQFLISFYLFVEHCSKICRKVNIIFYSGSTPDLVIRIQNKKTMKNKIQFKFFTQVISILKKILIIFISLIKFSFAENIPDINSDYNSKFISLTLFTGSIILFFYGGGFITYIYEMSFTLLNVPENQISVASTDIPSSYINSIPRFYANLIFLPKTNAIAILTGIAQLDIPLNLNFSEIKHFIYQIHSIFNTEYLLFFSQDSNPQLYSNMLINIKKKLLMLYNLYLYRFSFNLLDKETFLFIKSIVDSIIKNIK